MKKSLMLKWFIGLVIGSFLLLGCKQNFENAKGSSLCQTYEEPKTVTGKAAKSYTDTIERLFTTINEYIDIDSTLAARSLAEDAITAEEFLTMIQEILPEDLSTLKRIRKASNRSAEIQEEVSFEQELNEIIFDWDNTLSELLPDLTILENIQGITINNDLIYLENGMVFKLHSLEGVAVVNYLSSIAHGKSPSEASKEIEEDFLSLFPQEQTESRGLYMNPKSTNIGVLWPNGKVYYQWGNITNDHKNAVENAMKIWNKETGGLIKFEKREISDPVSLTFYLLGFIHCTTFMDADLNNKSAGETFPLGMGICNTVKLNKSISQAEYDRGALHEIGHVLGLQHEHQRADRDNYIIISESGLNDMKISEYLGGLRQVNKKYQIKILWTTITIEIPYIYYDPHLTRISYMQGDFDFDSIMLYSGYKLRPKYYSLKYGDLDQNLTYVTKYNTTLSATDIKTIKEMYKN